MPTRQKDGRYRTKLVLHPGEKPVWISGRTLREFERNKQLARQCPIRGREIPGFPALVEVWFEQIKRPRIRSASTLRSYQSAIRRHILPCFPLEMPLHAVRRADLQRCLDALEGRSATTGTLVLTILRHSLAYARAEGWMASDPAALLSLPAPSTRSPRAAFPPELAARLLAVAHAEPHGMMLLALYYLGCRRGELLALRWGDFDWDRRMVHIQRSLDFRRGTADAPTKTHAGERWVPLPSTLAEALLPLRGAAEELLFSCARNQPLTESVFRTRWTRLMRAADCVKTSRAYQRRAERLRAQGQAVPPPSRAGDFAPTLTPHAFRHNYITACVAAGVPPEVTMRIVGHSDYRTTVNVYTHLEQEKLHEAVVNIAGVLEDSTKE